MAIFHMAIEDIIRKENLISTGSTFQIIGQYSWTQWRKVQSVRVVLMVVDMNTCVRPMNTASVY